MSGQNPPTWPRGGPTGPPPSGPPPSGPPPGYLVPHRARAGPRRSRHGRPPSGGPPYLGGPPPGPPPAPRRRRWPIIWPACSRCCWWPVSRSPRGPTSPALRDRPLSAKDKAAVSAIADGVEPPSGRTPTLARCAADELVHETRSAELEKRGPIDADGDGWTYSGEWRYPDAMSYVEALLDCSDDWAEQIGTSGSSRAPTAWPTSAPRRWPGTSSRRRSRSPRVRKRRTRAAPSAVSALDECYVADPPEPSAKARSAYRAVVFAFDDLGPRGGRRHARGPGRRPTGSRRRPRRMPWTTDAGGRKGCVDARVEATFPWGTTSATDKRFCGRSKPARIWWVRREELHRTPRDAPPGTCATRGSRPSTPRTCGCSRTAATATPRADSASTRSSTSATGRRRGRQLVGLPGYSERFEARIRKMTALLPS